MTNPRPPKASTKRVARRSPVKRLDGVRHWPRTLDQYVWLLLRAGIKPSQLTASLSASVRKHQKTRPLAMPTPEVLEYSRVLTHWQNEHAYVDETGTARFLKLTGRMPSFTSLVRQALPSADAKAVMVILLRHRLIARARDGRVRMLATAFLPRSDQKAQFLAYTLSQIQGIMDTCYSNLTKGERSQQIALLQRAVVAERFDMTRLAEYDVYLRNSARAFLADHDAWLKRREIKEPSAKPYLVGHVGLGIFGFCAR